MIRTNLKKNRLIKKLKGNYEYNFWINRKLNIVKLFLLRLRFKKAFRSNRFRLRFLFKEVYRENSFWVNRVKKFQRLKTTFKPVKLFNKILMWFITKRYSLKLTKKKVLTRMWWTYKMRQIAYFTQKKVHFKRNLLKFYSTSFFDRPIYFKYRTKFCKYFLKRQKFRLMYGFLKLKKIRKIVHESLKYKNAVNVFIYKLESRLDVLLYRLNFVKSIRQGRQLILHGKIYVNNKVVRLSSYNLKSNDILTFAKSIIYNYKKVIFSNIKSKFLYKIRFPNYIEYSLNNLLFKFTRINKYDVKFWLRKIRVHSFISLLNFYNKCLF